MAQDKPPIVLDEPPDLPYPFFPSVPLLPKENKAYRLDLRRRCAHDAEMRALVLSQCRQDSLYWLSTFCSLFEPRPEPKIIPFIPWTHQIPAWKTIEKWMGHADVGLEKSRAEGASWLVLMLILWKWLFVPLFAAGLVSKDERAVDDPKNPDSLMWKLSFQLSRLPAWMVPEFERTVSNHMLINMNNGATISGYSCTANVASGGRKTVFLMDELAKFPRGPDQAAMNSTQYVTDSRLLVSTPYGPTGAYFEAMTKSNSMVKVVLDWAQNPVRSIGGYKVLIAKDDRRKLELVDHAYWKHRAIQHGTPCETTGDLLRMADRVEPDGPNPFHYPFMMTGPYVRHDALRSPWYDRECSRPAASPQDIAQELDRNYGGSTSSFFDLNMLTRLQASCVDPVCRGEMAMPGNVESYLDLQKVKFQIAHGGRMALWIRPDLYGRINGTRNYVIGGDVSAGGGGVATSNSALEVLDRLTGKQVAEFVSPMLTPAELADYAVAMCYYFTGPSGPAQLIWEMNGPNGAQFAQRISQLGYSNIYYRSQEEEFSERETRKMGWWTSTKTKPALLGEMARALQSGQLEVSSFIVLDEAKFYVNLIGGKIEHLSQSKERDPAGAGERHGDRVIALALAWWIVKEYLQDGNAADFLAATIPADCAFGRRQLALKEDEKSHAWVPPSQRRFSKKYRRQ